MTVMVQAGARERPLTRGAVNANGGSMTAIVALADTANRSSRA
jgi:hypothetical protein